MGQHKSIVGSQNHVWINQQICFEVLHITSHFVLMYHGFHLLTADEMKPKTNFDKRVYLAFTKKFKSLQDDSFLWWWWWSDNSEKCDRSVESKRGRLPSTTQQQRGLGKWTLWKCSRVRTPLEMICNFFESIFLITRTWWPLTWLL